MVPLEKSKRLTESALWDLQRLAYAQFGPDAWRNKGVPFYLTSNPLIAKYFSTCIIGYLRDLMRLGKEGIDLTQPFYVFDLGAGSGRLGYLILKTLIQRVKEIISPDLNICYVMTDVVGSNLEFLRSHSYLKTFVQSGNLDFAFYHHAQKDPIRLLCSGLKLDQNTLVNPICLICTYYFDTIPQDLFKANHGRLEEGRISISVPDSEFPADRDHLRPEMITQLEVVYDYVETNDPSHYYLDRPECNALLLDYLKTFENTPFLFPIGGLESLRFFSIHSKNRFLLLAGDQGVSTEEQVRGWGEPKISKHASFSMAVSYDLIAKYFLNQGGNALLTSFPNPKYVVMAGIFGGDESVFPEVSIAFRDGLDFFEPVEYLELTDLKPTHLAEMSLGNVLLYIKLGNWDPINFLVFFSEIQKKSQTLAR